MKKLFHLGLMIIGMSVTSLSLSAAPVSSHVTQAITNRFYPPYPPSFYPPYPPAIASGSATTQYYPPYPPSFYPPYPPLQ